MTFREVVEALRARQQHVVHQGTVRALLCAAAFVCRDGRWFTAPDSAAAARQLRKAIVLVGKGETEAADSEQETQNLTARTIASHVTGRLRELIEHMKE